MQAAEITQCKMHLGNHPRLYPSYKLGLTSFYKTGECSRMRKQSIPQRGLDTMLHTTVMKLPFSCRIVEEHQRKKT